MPSWRWLGPAFLVPLGVAAALSLALWLDHLNEGVVERWELATYDWRFQWRGPRDPSKEILVVYVDDDSLAKLELRGSVPRREQFARAIDNALEGGATVVGLDYVFAECDPARAGDRALQQALARADGWVVLACHIARGSVGNAWVLPAPELRAQLPALPDAEQAPVPPAIGFINIIPDRDGRVRRMRPLAARSAGEGSEQQLIRSFALELLWLHLDIRGDLDLHPAPHVAVAAKPDLGKPAQTLWLDRTLVNFVGPARSFESISFWQLVAGEVPEGLLDGRAVLIGDATTVRGGADFKLTPYTRNKPAIDPVTGFEYFSEDAFPGVDYHASSLQTMLEQRYVSRVDYLASLRVAGLLALFVGMLAWSSRVPMGAALGVAVVGVAGWLGLAWHHFVVYDRWLDVVAPLVLIGAQLVVGSTAFTLRLLRQRHDISALFGRYVSENYVELLLERVREGENVGELLIGIRREVSVLFSDVRGFTSLSEHLPPETIARILKRYFNEMTRIVREDYQGTMDKLLGDGLMAFFNAPLDQPDHALRACRVALSMRRAVERLSIADLVEDIPDDHPAAARLRSEAPLAIGVGINSGSAIVGDLGSDTFADYTVLGDTVNLAARLEALNKLYGTAVLISEETRALVDEQLLCRRLDRVRVKGRGQPVWVSEVLCERAEASDEQLAEVEAFEAAVARRADGHVTKARTALATIDDKVARTIVQMIDDERGAPVL